MVRLLSSETEMGAEGDALLPADAGVGRPYDLLVHDFPGYVLTTHLTVVGSPIDLQHQLTRGLWLPCTGRADPRWGWKVSELEAMQALQPPLALLLGE